METRAQQARQAVLVHGEALRTKAAHATHSLSTMLQSRGVPPQAAQSGAYITLVTLGLLTPLATTAIALTLCWLCVAASVVVAALAACLAFGTGMLVLAFMALACMATAAFAMALLVTVAIGVGGFISLAMVAAGFVGIKLFAQIGSGFFTRLDTFTSSVLVLGQCMPEPPISETTCVTGNKSSAMEEAEDTVVMPVNCKVPSTDNHQA